MLGMGMPKGVGGGAMLGKERGGGGGGGRQNGQFVSVRFTYPRVVCDVALLADKVRLPSTFPLSSINGGEEIGGAAAT